MIRENSMVAWAGRLTKVVTVESGEALIVWIDHIGRVQERHVPLDALVPFAEAIRPRSLWPDVNGADDVEQKSAPSKGRHRRQARAHRARHAA